MKNGIDVVELLEKADQGDADAQCKLGKIYESENKLKDALKYYECASSQNIPEAQFRLGNMYYLCKGVPLNYQVAREFFEKAAQNGYVEAQFSLGWMYEHGEGIPSPDFLKAKKWYEEAAAQGHTKAKERLENQKNWKLPMLEQAIRNRGSGNDDIPKDVLLEVLFEFFLDEFRKWLICEVDPPFSYNSANSYKSYVEKIRDVFNAEHPGVKFEELLDNGAGDSVTYADCSAFVAHKILSTYGSEQKYWRNTQSALHRFDDFLSEWHDDDAKDEHVLHSSSETFSQNDKKLSKNDGVKSVSIYDETPNVIDTKTHKELVNRFLLRLKTQSRWYPNFGTENGLLFPTRLLGRIFSNVGSDYWKQWMISGLENMQILIGENDVCRFSEVEHMNLLSNGECSVYLKGKNDCRTLYTHTANGSVIVARVNGDWKNVSIDHIHPLENILREKAGQLSSFLELTNLFFLYKETCGFYLNPRVEDDWGEEFFKAYETKLLGMADNIVLDLKKLTFDYELMERHENTRKGAGIEKFFSDLKSYNSNVLSYNKKLNVSDERTESLFLRYQKNAAKGDPDAQFSLGKLFFAGCDDVARNPFEAKYWWEKAAEQNNICAQYCLARMYRDGVYVDKNEKRARELWDKCKESIELRTIHELSQLFFEKQDEIKDDDENSLNNDSCDNNKTDPLSLYELSEELKRKARLERDKQFAPYFKEQQNMQELQSRSKNYLPAYIVNGGVGSFSNIANASVGKVGRLKNEKQSVVKISKSHAIHILRNEGLSVSGQITFSSQNSGVCKYWANPSVSYIFNDWWLILNDIDNRVLNVFFIPANSIQDEDIVVRADKPELIDIQINYGDDSFLDSRSKIKFRDWLVKSIGY